MSRFPTVQQIGPSVVLAAQVDRPVRLVASCLADRPWWNDCEYSNSTRPARWLTGPGHDDRFIGYRQYLTRRASAFSRQAAASCGKLAPGGLRGLIALPCGGFLGERYGRLSCED
jgi:hypothetical protein